MYELRKEEGRAKRGVFHTVHGDIHAIVTELTRAGIRCDEEADAITIYPGQPHAALIETYDDHRMAMAFSLLGLRTDGIIIHNPSCCRKTFEDYFEILDALSRQDGSQSL